MISIPSLDLAAIETAGSVVVSDSVGLRTGLAAHLRPMTRVVRFCGYAVTAEVDPGDNRAAYEALASIVPGSVLVVSSAGTRDVAMVGGSLAGHSRNRGAVAIVTDGMVRDTAALDRVGMPVWAAGTVPNAPTKLTRGRVNIPVRIGGVTIAPGDIVVGDEDGVAVVPREAPADLVERLKSNLEREKQAELAVARGDTEPAWLRAARATERASTGP